MQAKEEQLCIDCEKIVRNASLPREHWEAAVEEMRGKYAYLFSSARPAITSEREADLISLIYIFDEGVR